MAITYGFFNSQNSDRTYDADDFNTCFEGLISQNGVFQNADNAFAVSAGSTGLTVNVGTGKAMVQSHWVKSDAVVTLSLSAANSILSRYDMITLRYDATNRNISLQVTEGTSSSNPEYPMPEQTADLYEIVLAYVYVVAGASSITSQNIIDTRADTSICGYIYSLLDIGSELQEEIEALQTAVNNITNDFNNIQGYLSDTGWIAQDLSESFIRWNSSSYPRARKIGKMVQICGTVKPTTTLVGSADKVMMFNLAPNMRPSFGQSFVCQGSQACKWLMQVDTNGDVSFSRYSNNGGTFVDIGTSVWLPFSATFFVD